MCACGRAKLYPSSVPCTVLHASLGPRSRCTLNNERNEQPPTKGICRVWLIGKFDIYQCVRTVSVLLLFEVSLGMYEYVCTYSYVPTHYILYTSTFLEHLRLYRHSYPTVSSEY